jgi:predicted nucleic acid-binding protein
MPDNVYVDTSFFIATQITNHPFHQEALTVLETHKDSPFYFSFLTIDEIVFTLLNHKITPPEIATIITNKIISIKNTRIVSFQNKIKYIQEYVDFWKETALKPRDAMHAYLMKLHSITTIATFDADFKRNRKKLGITIIGLPEVKPHKSPKM